MHNPTKAFVILTPGFPVNEGDTSCLPPVQQFVLSLKNQFPNIKPIVVSLQYPFTRTNYIWNGVEVVSIGGENKRHLWNRITRLKALRALQKLHPRYELMGVLSFWCTDTALVANRFSLKNNLKHYIWIHGQDAKKENKLVSKIKPVSNQLIALSDFLKAEFLKNHGIEPFHVIENGITESQFPGLNTSKRNIDILGAGSLIPLKNYALFIELIAELKTTNPTLTALIAGGGKELDGLRHQIKTLGLEKTIVLAGPQSHNEVLMLMNNSNIFLHTSSYEGNSTVLIESLYSGCKTVSTCALSNRSVENLYVCGDKEDLKQKLSELLSKSEGERKRILFNTIDHSTKKIMALYGI